MQRGVFFLVVLARFWVGVQLALVGATAPPPAHSCGEGDKECDLDAKKALLMAMWNAKTTLDFETYTKNFSPQFKATWNEQELPINLYPTTVEAATLNYKEALHYTGVSLIRDRVHRVPGTSTYVYVIQWEAKATQTGETVSLYPWTEYTTFDAENKVVDIAAFGDTNNLLLAKNAYTPMENMKEALGNLLEDLNNKNTAGMAEMLEKETKIYRNKQESKQKWGDADYMRSYFARTPQQSFKLISVGIANGLALISNVEHTFTDANGKRITTSEGWYVRFSPETGKMHAISMIMDEDYGKTLNEG